MHPSDTVHELRDPQVDHDARQRQCVDTFQVELVLHQLEHRIRGCAGGFVESSVKAEREASATQATGVFSGGPSSIASVSSSRSSGHSIAVCETSPSPWRA